jgi:beta-galactosidase
MNQRQNCMVLLLACAGWFGAAAGRAERISVSLDGTWQVADSVSASQMPERFTHEAPVPGLTNLSTPPFADVDGYYTPEHIRTSILYGAWGAWPAGTKVQPGPRQSRNYFWYRKVFRVPVAKRVAILKINKAQFSTAVWMNGVKIGEHLGCFSATYMDVSKAIRWTGENEVVVRIGAHPGVLPVAVMAGRDGEKRAWTPGIYDSVALLVSDNPVIETVQVAPRLATQEITVQTEVRNYSDAPISFRLAHRVVTWKGGQPISASHPQSLRLQPGEQKTFTENIRIANPTLWTPASPFLYLLKTSTGGDSIETRFGMREFRFDTATRRAYLNGKVFFMRGSNITLHRFFEDPQCKALPWNEQWVRKLLIEIPKRMHWNSFRMCIGPAPDKWLDIADEAGLLIQNEFPVWTGRRDPIEWDTGELIQEFKEWMRDHWNHPSVAIWDACNETIADVMGAKVIPAVRPLDLSNRPWDNGYNQPAGPDDAVEDHPYLYSTLTNHSKTPFKIVDLEQMTGAMSTNAPHPTGHAVVIDEYGWLWLKRDGSPTSVTQNVWAVLAPNSTAKERLSLNAYLVAGLTEFWRAHRNAAGVLHFVYLSSNHEDVFTADHFRDVERLEFQPGFEEYVGEAFKPLGVYINFWRTALKPNTDQRFAVMMINDEYGGAEGKLSLTLEAENGTPMVQRETDFAVPGLGQQTYNVDLHIPGAPGKYVLKAVARAQGTGDTTTGRRRVSIEGK